MTKTLKSSLLCPEGAALFERPPPHFSTAVHTLASGFLLIDGKSYTPNNNTIGTTNAVVWVPPVVQAPQSSPAFRVYVENGIDRSVKTVDVTINQGYKTHLLAWGNNSQDNETLQGSGSGSLGDGTVTTPNDYDVMRYMFQNQNRFNLYPSDPTWTISYDTLGSYFGQPVRRVSNIDSANSVSCYGSLQGHCAVTTDHNLWFWGSAESWALGRSKILGYALTNFSVFADFVTNWDLSLLDNGSYKWGPFWVNTLTPVPVLDPATQLPLTGVEAAEGMYVLKTDGSLWSWGYTKPLLGRDPQDAADRYDRSGTGVYGMILGRVEIEGNNSNGIVPGREIVELSAPTFVNGQNGVAFARCKDGSIWGWGGILHDSSLAGTDTDQSSDGQQYDCFLGGGDQNTMATPIRMINIERVSPSPIIKICQSWNHIIFLRADGSVSELGYIPKYDTQRLVSPEMYRAGDYLTISLQQEGVFFDFDSFYSTNPVVVTNIPVNIQQVCAAPSFGAMLTDSGDVWVWGQWLGQLLPSPQKIQSLRGITKIVAGNQYIIALDQQRRLWGVGINNDGIFGFNDLAVKPGEANSDNPFNDLGIFHTNAVRIVGVENVSDIFSGDNADWNSQMYAVGLEVVGKPTGLTAVPMDHSVQLVWSNYPAATSYVIYRSLNEDAGYLAIGHAPSNAYWDQSVSLENGQNYYYRVTAVVNGVETLPSWDVIATPYPTPGPAQNPFAGWTCYGVSLQWQPPTNVDSSPLQEYAIFQNGVELAELERDATNYYDSTTSYGSDRTNYLIISRNSAGEATNSFIFTNQSRYCEPAPYVPTNTTRTWLKLVNNGSLGSDVATMVWSGSAMDGNWLFEGAEFDTNRGNYITSATETVNPFVQHLSSQDTNADVFATWLWTQFTPDQTNAVLSTNSTEQSNLAVVISALNLFLTNGVGVSNLDFLNYGITNGGFLANGKLLRAATTNLFVTFPTGTNLIQLKRMLLDDNFGGQYFVRGANWGDGLTGFRIHYRVLQYVNRRKIEREYQRDVNIASLSHTTGYDDDRDDEDIRCGIYKYSWPVPQGALCWASVGALVDGQEGEISHEIGPAWANSDYVWQANLRAIPGNHQIYLDWNDDASIDSYSIYYSTNSDATNHINQYDPGFEAEWVLAPDGASVTMNRYWHVGLSNDVTYYYTVLANSSISTTPFYAYTNATVISTNPPSRTNFTAYASAYDGMVLVEWKVPKTNLYDPDVINQADWQFFVERKPAGTNDEQYQLVSDTGLGLAYLDTDVTDGTAYTYRVTAFDSAFNCLRALAVDESSGMTQTTPTAANGLTLLSPVPGNAYVDLTWSPIRATRFTVKHSLSLNGPFDILANLDVQNAYQSAGNTYRDVAAQNGVTNYYQISATTPTGFLIDSSVRGALPLSVLAPLPPSNFRGTLIPETTTNTVLLKWNAQNGAAQYQVFLQDQTSLLPIYAGGALSCLYAVPPMAGSDDVFTFKIRAMSSQGMAGDFAQVTITNETTAATASAIPAVILQVAGATESLTVVGPTNLTLGATVNLPDIQQVSFYSDGQLVGSVDAPPYQMVWYHVPGGVHAITALALIQGNSAANYISGQSVATFSSDVLMLTNVVQSQLSAYQNSVTDLQLPAPGLPISLTRSYSSRSIETNSVLGVGWTPAWSQGAVRLSADLGTGWTSDVQHGSLGDSMYLISDTGNHYVSVTLPGGGDVEFWPQLDYINSDPHYLDPFLGYNIGMNFTPYGVNQGTLDGGIENLEVTADGDNYDASDWAGQAITFSDISLSGFKYTTSDGTVYSYYQPGDGAGLVWLLTKVTDRSGNSLNYSYDSNNNLTTISNACGRSVTFAYTSQAGATNVSVYDAIGGQPTIVYVITNNLLTEVHQLVDRSGVYQTNYYSYGVDAVGAPQDYLRLTSVYDARRVRMLLNEYTNSTGDLLSQISPGRTNKYIFNPTNYNLTVQSAAGTATNTAVVTSDASGVISGATLPASGTVPSTTNGTQCVYDQQGNLVSQTDANGNTKTYTYDNLNRLVEQSDELGHNTYTQLNDYGQPVIFSDAKGAQTVYNYDDVGNPIYLRDPSGTITSYAYSSTVTDTSGNVRLGEMQASESQTALYVPYNIVNRSIYVTNGSIVGDLAFNIQEWVDGSGVPVGPVLTNIFTYDANGNRLTEVKTRTVNGGIQSITNASTYDAQNRVIITVVSAGGAETLAPQTNRVNYNVLGKQATSTDAAGRVTTSVYDFNASLIETEYPDGTVSRTSYDGFGRQEYVQDRTMTNSSGASTAPATHNTYDASGRVIRVDKYDAVNLTETTAGSGDYTALAGAPPQCKLVATSPGNLLTTTLTFYDAAGQVQYTVDARGAVTQNLYDGAGRRTNVLVCTDYNYCHDAAAGGTNAPNVSSANTFQSTSYTYDANGNQVTVTDAAGHTTTSVYDNANRVIEVDSPATGGGTAARKMYYDGLGRKFQETDEAGVSTAYMYDFRGLLLSVTLAAGTGQQMTTVYTYDEMGNELSQTDANGHTTTFQYDALGRRTGRTLPGGQSEGSYYDPLTGNLIYQTNFNGVVITNGYDVANRLTNSASVNGYRVSYGYNVTNGWRTNMVDASGTTVWRYNAVGQLTNKVVAWANGPVATLNYGYDALGSLTNLWSGTVNGATNAYQYDLLGRLTNVLANGSVAAGYGFDYVGNLQTLRYGNGVTNVYQYDAQNRLTNQVWKLNSTAVAGFAYTLGPTGNRMALAETVATASRTNNWAYDYLYRVTGETISGAGTVNYGYDAVGNRTNRTSSISQLTNAVSSYTANDWLASDTYDANGSTTASSGNSYQYDALNHLTNANNGAILMTYDGDGNRASKKVGGTNTYYLLDDRNPSGYVQVLEEWTVTSTATNLGRVYNYGLNLISQRAPNTSTNYFVFDGHGSTRALMDAGGNVVNTFAYDAYGTLIASNGLPETSYLYCGQQYDSDLGLCLNRARYLNAGTGRFWTMDTYEGNSEDPLPLHKYLYVKDNPIMRTDPSGHDDIGDVLGAMAISFSLDALPNVGTVQGALSSGDTCGPDVSRAVFATEMDINTTFINAGKARELAAMFSPIYRNDAWDVQKLNDLGQSDYTTDFGNGSSLGAGLTGKQTVQFGMPGKTRGVYYANAVNYFLWGRMLQLASHYLTDPLTGLPDPDYDESTAIAAAKFHKWWRGDSGTDYEKQAVAFVKFGYDGVDPSSAAINSIKPNPNNIASPSRFNWKWVGLHDNEQ